MKQLKSCDKFGHPIQLQFNNQGPEYKTYFGACVSIGINALMIFYVFVLTKKWILMEDNALTTISKSVAVEDLGVVPYEELGFYPFISIID